MADAADMLPEADAEPSGPGAYGEMQAQDGVEFVILNDAVLTSVSKATTVLVDGNDLEMMAVLYQFPQFLEHCPDESLHIMVPQICRGAVGWKPDVQMAAAEALYFVVNMKAPEFVAKQIVVAALQIIGKSESGEVFDACGEILSMMLPQVQRKEVLELVVPATVERAVAANPESRRLAARIIGSLNDSMTAKELEDVFLRQALTLADDEDASVRAMIAQSLSAVGIKLPLRVSERHLWPKLKVLMRDENARVRAAAMRAIARSAEAHRAHASSSKMYRTMLMPMFLEECDRAGKVGSSDLRNVSDDTYLMLEIFSEVYGYFLCAVSPLFADEEIWTAALNTLRRMVTCNGPTVRHWCAFNMPAIASVCVDSRTDKIAGVVQALSVDSDVETRATLAAGIHETTRLLGHGPLRDEIIHAVGDLLTDENAQVRMNSLGHFSDLLTLLSTHESAKASLANGLAPKEKASIAVASLGNSLVPLPTPTVALGTESGVPSDDPSAGIRQLAPIFASLEMMSVDSWRTQELLATELRKSAHLVPQEMLCEHVAPLLFQMARESTYLVRQASMRALMHVLRCIPDVRRRNHILKHFRLEWARGKVYWTRLAYIDGCECAHSMFSVKLFTQLFKEELISMAKDPVPNVRLRLVRLFPVLLSIWKNRPEFQEVLQAFATDADPQVAGEATKLLNSLSSVQPLTPQQLAEDKKKEALEDAFYIHKNYKKKKVNKAKGEKGDTGKGNGQTAPSSKTPSIPSTGNGKSPASDASGPAKKPAAPRSDVGSRRQPTAPQNAVPAAQQASFAPERKRESSALQKALCGCFGGG